MILLHVYKSGRAFNGFHRDAGTIVHVVPGPKVNGDWFGKALCGTEPGRRGNGWSETTRGISCDKCISKLSKIDDWQPLPKAPTV